MTVTGIVLAGGRGSRLGGVDKSSLDVGGVSTLDRVHAALEPVASELILVVNDPASSGADRFRVVQDPSPHAGVLPALRAAMYAATNPVCVLVACDMPFLSTTLLRWLSARADPFDVVMPIVADREQPMHAVYRRESCGRAIDDALAHGKRRMIAFLDDLAVDRVDEAAIREVDGDLRSFFNINTADDLEEARRLVSDDNKNGLEQPPTRPGSP